jgi:hypothetical protein
MQTKEIGGCKLHQINDRTIERGTRKEITKKNEQSSGDIPINNGLS